MKILHIGDIHLGSHLDNNPRNEEIRKVFDFILEKVKSEKVEAALIAGDVFDNGQPSVGSQEMYYKFLLNLREAGCRQIVVIAGNHDSANFLDAPRWLLGCLDIHIVGNVSPADLSQEVVLLGEKDSPVAIVCAVPFLHYGDVKSLIPEDTVVKDHSQALAHGIAEHYKAVWKIADGIRQGRNIPIIGMGHLYASGSSFETAKAENVVGKLEDVDLKAFAECYDYMALGHIHKPQHISGHENWRYAGSLLPMKIQVHNHATEVVLLDTNDLQNPTSIEIPCHCIHAMKYISGNMDELRGKLEEIRKSGTDTWVKVVYTGAERIPNWGIDLQLTLRGSKVQIVDTEVRREVTGEPGGVKKEENIRSLAELTPEEVFKEYVAKYPEKFGNAAQQEELLWLYRTAQGESCSSDTQKEKTPVATVGVMKFKRLFMRNVNSLYGDNTIDFEDPSFNSGIFLIEGPTGAGKTSILDAICLALYGQTPRADISATKNPVISSGAKDICAELTFMLGKDEYKACFYQKRTKNAQNPFNQAQRSLYKNEVALTEVKDISSIIGMKLEQFTQCVLLAQGSFDAFLKANDKERSSLLTQITGTEIYKTIGTEISKKCSEVQTQKAILDGQLKGITLMGDEEVEALEKQAEQITKDEENVERSLRQCYATEQIFRNIEKFNKDVQASQERLRIAESEQAASSGERVKLDGAKRAQRVQAEYDALKKKQDEVSKKCKDHERLEQEKSDLEQKAIQADKANQCAQEALREKTAVEKAQKELIRQVRELDTQIEEKSVQFRNAKNEFDNAESTWKENERTFQQEQKKWTERQRTVQDSRDYLAAHAADASLAGKQEAWELRRQGLATQEKDNIILKKKIDDDRASLVKEQNQLQKKQAEQVQCLTKIEEIKKNIGETGARKQEALGGKNKEELDTLWAAAGKLQEFFKGNNARQSFLEQGKRCPLCGAIEHPYCDGTAVPEEHDYGRDMKNLDERRRKVAECDSVLNRLENERGKFEVSLTKGNEECASMEAEIARKTVALTTAQEELSKAQKLTEKTAADLAAEFRKALQVEWTDHSCLPVELQIRIEAYAVAQKEIESQEKESQDFEQKRAAHEAVEKKDKEQLEIKKTALEGQQKALAMFQKRRQDLLGEQDTEVFEKKLEQEMALVRKKAEDGATCKAAADTALKSNREQLRKIEAELEEMRPQEQMCREAFQRKLQECEFKGQEEYQQMWLSPEEMQALQDKLMAIQETVNKARTTYETQRTTLCDEQKKLPDGMERSKNQEDCDKLEREKKELREQAEKISNRLEVDQDNRERSEKTKAQQAEIGAICKNWEILNDNFGGKYGDNFAKIAQGYTFRELLYCANRNRLLSLQKHFELVCDGKNPLELDVIDHYRGDQIRTARNLSGGETFEVSLALALGLADMSSISQKASLGNVLLDEGFGTLDDEALESALDLLSQLNRSDGKLVGIISHVGKLADRIPTQIHVCSNCGLGTLSGAGVTETIEEQLPEPAKKTKGRRKKG